MGGGIEPSTEETIKSLEERNEFLTSERKRLIEELKQAKKDEDTIARFMAKVLRNK